VTARDSIIGGALGASFLERTTKPLAVLLHHRIQNLVTRIDAQFEKRLFRIARFSLSKWEN
jgi:hypothetical protein